MAKSKQQIAEEQAAADKAAEEQAAADQAAADKAAEEQAAADQAAKIPDGSIVQPEQEPVVEMFPIRVTHGERHTRKGMRASMLGPDGESMGMVVLMPGADEVFNMPTNCSIKFEIINEP